MKRVNQPYSRRDFLKTASAGAAGTILAPTILSSCAKGANDRVMLAHIGVGSRGQAELKNYFMPLAGSYSVASCDPFQERRDDVAAYINDFYKQNGITAPRCRAYLDFEEILERDDIDAVHITTPDHWHVPAAVKAARAGKHIMLAKPLGLSYPNFKVLEKELLANDVRFHYGTQQRSMRHMQRGIEMLRSGMIGDIGRVDVWAPGKNPVESPVCKEVPVPETFDYDRWTGPAPLNPYCPERVTNNGSWFQWDYSIGFLAGWGAHPLDVMIWGLKEKLDGPYSCSGTGKYWEPGGIYNNILSWEVDYDYTSGIKVHFFSTDVAEGKDLLHYRKLKEGNGTTFYGTKGWISLSRSSAQSDIPELNRELNNFPQNDDGWIQSEENTMGQLFLDVITGKSQETCPLEEAILSDTISHMGNICIRRGRIINWNPVNGSVENDSAANKWFVREMRPQYTI